MPHVSRKKIDGKTFSKISEYLILSLSEIRDKKEMEDFLKAFLSQTERLMLSKRLAVAYMLSENITEDEIAQILSIGKPTIVKTRLWIRLEGAGYKIALEILRKSAMYGEFKQLFVDILRKMDHPYKGILGQAHE